MAKVNISVVRDYPRDIPITGVFHLLERGRGGIRQSNPLAHLSDEDLETVLNRARRCRIKPKHLLFRQGDRHRGIFLIQSGVVVTHWRDAPTMWARSSWVRFTAMTTPCPSAAGVP